MCMAQDQWSLRFLISGSIIDGCFPISGAGYFFVAQGMCTGEIFPEFQRKYIGAAVCGSQGHMMRLFEPVQCLVVVDADDGVVVGHVAGYLVVPGGAGSIALIHVGDGLAAVETASGTEIVLSQGS